MLHTIYIRLPYVVSEAPSIFQRVIDSLFQRMPNVLVHLDDILITDIPEEGSHLNKYC